MKKSEVAELVMMLMAAFPNAKTTDGTSQVYEAMLADLDVALARRSVQRLISTSKFLPSIAEIREAATAQQHGPRKTGAEAYEELLEAVQRHGGTPAVRWVKGEMRMQSPWPPLEPDVAAAMRQTWGSWSDCCKAPDAQEMADRARFIAAYDGLSERERADLVSGQRLPAPDQSAPKLITQQQKTAKGAVAPLPRASNKTGEESRPVGAPSAAAAPEAIQVPIAPPRAKPGPTPFAQRMADGWRPTGDEIEAELARHVGGAL